MNTKFIDSGILKKKFESNPRQVVDEVSIAGIFPKRTISNFISGRLFHLLPEWAWFRLGYVIESQNRGGKP